jgi:hypothetical protein
MPVGPTVAELASGTPDLLHAETDAAITAARALPT